MWAHGSPPANKSSKRVARLAKVVKKGGTCSDLTPSARPRLLLLSNLLMLATCRDATGKRAQPQTLPDRAVAGRSQPRPPRKAAALRHCVQQAAQPVSSTRAQHAASVVLPSWPHPVGDEALKVAQQPLAAVVDQAQQGVCQGLPAQAGLPQEHPAQHWHAQQGVTLADQVYLQMHTDPILLHVVQSAYPSVWHCLSAKPPAALSCSHRQALKSRQFRTGAAMVRLWLSDSSATSCTSQQMRALGPQFLSHQGLEVCVYAHNEGCNDGRPLWQQHTCLLSCSLSCSRGINRGQLLLSLLQADKLSWCICFLTEGVGRSSAARLVRECC